MRKQRIHMPLTPHTQQMHIKTLRGEILHHQLIRINRISKRHTITQPITMNIRLGNIHMIQ